MKSVWKKFLSKNHGKALTNSYCKVCGRAFAMKCNLITRMRIHTGETPFSCGQCGTSFARKGVLKSHMKIHF